MDFTSVDAKAGVMMRSAATDTAPYALACVSPGNGVSFQYRATDAAAAVVNATVNRVAAPCWLRLVRVGANFTAYYAADTNGVAGAWQALGTTQAITFAAAPNAFGLAVTSKADGTNCTAVFDHLGGTAKLGGERTVTVTPLAGVSGTSLVTLTASDGAATAVETFSVMVGPNKPPAISVVANVTGIDGAAIPSFTVMLSDVHSDPANLTLTAGSSNPLLLPANRVSITGTGATRTITLLPVPSETGTATVTLSSSDGSLIGTRTFTLTMGAGDPTFVIRSGANWRYRDNGNIPSAAWYFTSFSDTAWFVGPAQFGYGEGDESTVVNAGPAAHYITTYFRRIFTIADPAQIAQAAIRLLCDDGAVVFLNGVPLFRDNMPAGTVNNNTLAASDVSGAAEGVWHVFRFDPARLVAGSNTLAVEVHQSSNASDDVTFDLQLLAYARSAIPNLSLTLQSPDLRFLWPTWAAAWQLKSTNDFQTWSAVPGTPADNGQGQMLLTLPVSGAPKFFRLEAQ